VGLQSATQRGQGRVKGAARGAKAAHEDHLRVFRPTFKQTSVENTNVVIFMPLCSGFITFEGLGMLSGSWRGSRVPPGGANDEQKGPLEELGTHMRVTLGSLGRLLNKQI
jgi:hypothetical protein